MTDGGVYGGSYWFGDMAAQILNALMAMYQEAGLTGYMPAVEGATEDDALLALWNKLAPSGAQGGKDLKAFYDANWGAGQYDPKEAVRNWLSITDEDLPTKDPLALAETWNLVPKAREEAPTLARQQWEAATEQWQAQFDEAVRQADREFLRQQGLDEEAIRRYEQAWQRTLEMDAEEKKRFWADFARQEGLDEQAQKNWEAQHDLQVQYFAQARYEFDVQFAQQQKMDFETVRAWDEDRALQKYGIDLEHEYRQGQLALGKEEADIDRMWKTGQLELGGRELDITEALGGRELDIREALGQGELGLGYMGLLSQLRGPRDWLKYSQVQRQAQGGPLPGFAQNLINQQQMAGFQSSGPLEAITVQDLLGQPGQRMWQETLAQAIGQPEGGFSENMRAYEERVAALMAQGMTREQAERQIYQEHMAKAPVPLGGGVMEQFPTHSQTPSGGWGDQQTEWERIYAEVQAMPPQTAIPMAQNPYSQQAQQQQAAQFWQGLARNPHQMPVNQFLQMTPSEQQMMAGGIEEQGGVWEDWLTQLQRAAPRGQARSGSMWGGW